MGTRVVGGGVRRMSKTVMKNDVHVFLLSAAYGVFMKD